MLLSIYKLCPSAEFFCPVSLILNFELLLLAKQNIYLCLLLTLMLRGIGGYGLRVIGYGKVKYLFLFMAATVAVWNLGTTLLWQSKQVSTR